MAPRDTDGSDVLPVNGQSVIEAGTNSVPTQWFDSHCHLQDDRFGTGTADVVRRATDAGVIGFSCCATSESDWDKVIRLSQLYSSIVPFLGVHPWFYSDRSSKWLRKLEEKLVALPGAGVGEIGIDHTMAEVDYGEQEQVFIEQLRLATKLCRPVAIHCRKAFGRLIQILETEGGVPHGGVLHSYAGPSELVPQLVDCGLSISFSGSLTYKNSKRARSAAAVVPPHRLLIETDSPDIRPCGWESDLNEPCTIEKVGLALAQIRGLELWECANMTRENAKELFYRNRT